MSPAESRVPVTQCTATLSCTCVERQRVGKNMKRVGEDFTKWRQQGKDGSAERKSQIKSKIKQQFKYNDNNTTYRTKMCMCMYVCVRPWHVCVCVGMISCMRSTVLVVVFCYFNLFWHVENVHPQSK